MNLLSVEQHHEFPEMMPASSHSTLLTAVSEQLQEKEQIQSPFLEYVSQLRKKYLRNKKVLLIQTPQFQFETFNVQVAKNRGLYAYPPTGLQCIAKTISALGFEAAVLDLNYLLLKRIITENFEISRWLELLEEYLNTHDPAIVGLTSLTAYNDVLRPTHPLTAILAWLRERDQQMVIIGGPTATNEYEEYLHRGLCHVVILKEGEAPIEYLFQSLLDEKSSVKNSSGENRVVPISGIAYPTITGIAQTYGSALRLPLHGNLVDTYHLVPIEDYHNVGSLSPYSRMAGMDKNFSVFQLNRGCRANCKFCDVSKFMGRGVRSYGAKEVLDEIRYLVETRGVRHFEVLDDDFLGNTVMVTELLNGMAILHRQWNMTWSANNGLIAGSLTEELCALLRDSGCIGFRIGIESGNPEMIRRLRKPATLELLLKKGELLQQFPEMFTGANYILGLFGEETFAQMLDTFLFSCRLNLDWSSFSTFQFTSKETAIIENFKSTGRIANEFTPAKDNARGEILEAAGVHSGLAVFHLPAESVPSPEQVKQIWFTFNLVGNYFHNKNLRRGGHPAKFVAWVEAVRVVYPHNPYMPLFMALGQILLGDVVSAQNNLQKTRDNVGASEYWQHRFKQFYLMNLLTDFPQSPAEVWERLEKLDKRYEQWWSCP